MHDERVRVAVAGVRDDRDDDVAAPGDLPDPADEVAEGGERHADVLEHERAAALDGGRWFAGRKLAPRISPNKTLEGLLGGLAAGLLVAGIGALIAGAGVSQLPGVLLVAVFTVLFSVVGDLFESLLKRHVAVKDSGDLIPGHGGVLDRVDSVLAALPVFALGKLWLDF